MTVRNVRSYQTRGLIPSPQRQGRRSVYSDDHLRRLQEIRDARAHGATLALLATHLAHGGALSAGDVQRPWLPLSTAAGSSARQRRSRSTAPVDGLLSTGSRSRSELDQAITHGVLRRKGDQVHADRVLATGLAGVVTQGMPIDRVLPVLAAAAGAGASIGAALDLAMSNGYARGTSRQQLVDLVAWTLGAVVHP
jgi:DNA-binding transcriptional MerR regulator